MQHDRTKHIEIDRHFIKEKLEKGIIQIPYVPFEKHVADLLTKGLTTRRFEDLVCKLGMIDIHSLDWGGMLAEKDLNEDKGPTKASPKK